MNRRDTQQQLSAVGQAVREGSAITPGNYPVLSKQTHQGDPLWQLTQTQITMENWSAPRIAAWYERDAIDTLVLDDE
jgi:hypothetical protein